VRFLRESVKSIASRFVSKTAGRYSYPLFGIPSGLASLENKQLLYPGSPLAMPTPKSIEERLLWQYRVALQGLELKEEGILTLPQATATNKGGNLTSKGELITTFLQPIDGKPPEQNELFRFSTKRFLPRIYHATSPVLTLATGWQGAFYHWCFEVLPRLHLAEKAGHSSCLLYVEANFPFQKESLELLGIKAHQMINAHEYEAVYAPQLIIPSIPHTPTTWACNFLREQFLPKITKRSPLRLYVSRSDASRRRILNEAEVLDLLKKYHFECVHLSKLSFKEQVELFYRAEAVVGPHGAGFSNLVFCGPKTPFLEIFSPAYFNPCYWHVADRVGLSYHYLLGVGERYPDFFETHLDPDIVVDIDKLEASLKLMGL
jgi:hypothetical protein